MYFLFLWISVILVFVLQVEMSNMMISQYQLLSAYTYSVKKQIICNHLLQFPYKNYAIDDLDSNRQCIFPRLDYASPSWGYKKVPPAVCFLLSEKILRSDKENWGEQCS